MVGYAGDYKTDDPPRGENGTQINQSTGKEDARLEDPNCEYQYCAVSALKWPWGQLNGTGWGDAGYSPSTFARLILEPSVRCTRIWFCRTSVDNQSWLSVTPV